MKLILTLIKAVLLLLVITFAVKNTGNVALRWYFDLEWPVPVVFVVLGAFAAGAVTGLLMTVGPFVRVRREIKQLRRQERQRVVDDLIADDMPPPLQTAPTPVLPPALPRATDAP